MAFNEQNREDAYKFFVLTFNAVPGAKHAVDVVNAYNAGLNTAEIIEIYTSKDAFKAMYPTTQTSKEFAEALVANVASATASVAAKNAAVADIVKALDGGMTKGGVIYQVLGNLSTKPVTDLEWGTTVAQLQNKVAVAKALTEGDKALDTTDVATLQAAVKGVTEDAATVQQALDKSSVVATKLANLSAANKAKADFAATLDLNADGKADGLKANTVDDAINAATTGLVAVKAAAVSVAFASATTAAGRDAAVATLKAANDVTIAAAQTTLATAQAAAATAPAVTPSAISSYKASLTAVENAAKVKNDATALKAGLIAELAAATPAVTAVTSTTDITVAGASVVTVTDGVFTLNPNASTYASLPAAQKEVVTKLVAAANTEVSAVKSLDVVAKAFNTAYNAAVGTDAVDPATGILTAANLSAAAVKANNVVEAEKTLATEQNKNVLIDKAVAAYKDAVSLQDKLAVLNKAIADSEKAFTDANLPLPVATTEGGLLVATGQDDLYLPVAEKTSIAGFGVVGKDSIYIGSDYSKGADFSKGDDAKLEVFFKANGADTDVYVEQKVFGSSVSGAAAGNKDIFKITLTGVAADKLVLNDGFITLA